MTDDYTELSKRVREVMISMGQLETRVWELADALYTHTHPPEDPDLKDAEAALARRANP